MKNLCESIYIEVIKGWRSYCARKNFNHYKELMKRSGIATPELTKEQKKEIQTVWGKSRYFNYDTHKLAYWATGKFDAKVVPELLFRNEIEIKLNDQQAKYAWSDKNTFNLVLPKENTPNTIIRNMDGKLFDGNYKHIQEKDAIEQLNKYKDIFYKPARGSSFGKGIRKFNEFDAETLSTLGKNFVLQEKIEIHPELKKLNSTAVSIMRLITFYIDGNVYMTSGTIRVGTEGAITDYAIDKEGKGSLMIGITDDGKLKEFGYYPCALTSNKSFNGFEFGGMEIPSYKAAVDLVKKMHLRLPHFGYIGWDVTIDKNGTPIIIEYNIRGAGALYYQYTNGSLFGNDFNIIYNNTYNTH